MAISNNKSRFNIQLYRAHIKHEKLIDFLENFNLSEFLNIHERLLNTQALTLKAFAGLKGNLHPPKGPETQSAHK